MSPSPHPDHITTTTTPTTTDGPPIPSPSPPTARTSNKIQRRDTMFEAETFFETQTPPPGLQDELDSVRAFVDRHVKAGKRVVLITSGGTTVPLERNVVRFLDNFSAGTRGSSSAEHFLRSGKYAVIFMHRQHSLQPFSRHYSHSTNPFLDLLDVAETGTGKGEGEGGGTGDGGVEGEGKVEGEVDGVVDGRNGGSSYLFPSLAGLESRVSAASERQPATSPPSSSDKNPTGAQEDGGETDRRAGGKEFIKIRDPHQTPLLQILKSYKKVRSLDLLHNITFVTVQEYLFLLKGVSMIMGEGGGGGGGGAGAGGDGGGGGGLGRKGMYYLAAAVSDFFLPQQKMSEHKIQSGKGSLVIEMDQVPKVLRPLVQRWSNDGYIVSFKLETDPNLLIPKARAALERYGHQLVIGNDLNRRKFEVVFVERDREEEWIRLDPVEVNERGREIEEEIVDRLIRRHDRFIAEGRGG